MYLIPAAINQSTRVGSGRVGSGRVGARRPFSWVMFTNVAAALVKQRPDWGLRGAVPAVEGPARLDTTRPGRRRLVYEPVEVGRRPVCAAR